MWACVVSGEMILHCALVVIRISYSATNFKTKSI